MSAKNILFLLVIIAGPTLLSLSSFGENSCIYVTNKASTDINVSPTCRNGAQLLTVNGTVILCNPSPVRYDSCYISSIEKYCFAPDILYVGKNSIKYSGSFGHDVQATYYLMKVLIAPDSSKEEELCRVELGTSWSGDGLFNCSSEFSRSLEQIDPEAAQKIRELKEEIERIKKEFDQLETNGEDIEDLQGRLNELALKEIESLDPDQLLAVSNELKDLADFIRGLKTDIDVLKKSYLEKISNLSKSIAENKVSTLKRLEELGVKTDPNEFHDYPEIAIEAQDLVSDGDTEMVDREFDSKNNVYSQLSEFTLKEMQRSVESSDYVQLSKIYIWWSESIELLSSLLGSLSNVSRQELRTFKNSIEVVQTYYNKHMDNYGIRKDLAIPEHLKNEIAIELKKTYPHHAEKLINSFNTWKPGDLNKNQEQLFNALEVLVEIFRIFSYLPEMNHGVKNQVIDKFVFVANNLVLSAYDVGRWTPAGDFIDVCEALTGLSPCVEGKALNSEERFFALLGVVGGNRLFWGELSKLAKGPLHSVGNYLKSLISRFGEGIHDVLPFLQSLKDRKFASQLLESAAKLGLKAKERIVAFGEYLKLSIGNEVGAVGKIENAVKDLGEHGFILVEEGSKIRKVALKPFDNPKWGLTEGHLKKHFFGDSEFALNKIDPAGNADKWKNHLAELFNSPVSNVTSNGKLDIIKEFPKADGSGVFKMGIRLSENTEGTFDLVTVLTKQ